MQPRGHQAQQSQAIVPTQPGGVVRQGFGTTEIEIKRAATEAAAMREKATVEAMIFEARSRPRDWDTVRTRLLQECHRLGFAESAIWTKPRGGKDISGLSIRYAEAAIRAMGYVDVRVSITEEGVDYRNVMISVIDLENIIRYGREVKISKLTERKKLSSGQRAVSQRANSYGQIVYLVEATEDETIQAQAVEVSKVIRTEGLRLLPADIKEECEDLCREVITKGIAADPAAYRKKVADSFAKIGVMPDELGRYMGAKLDQLSPPQIEELRGIYQAISQGHTTWSEVKREKESTTPATPPQKAAPPAPALAASNGVQETVDETTGEVLGRIVPPAQKAHNPQNSTEAEWTPPEPPPDVVLPTMGPPEPASGSPEFGQWLLQSISDATDIATLDKISKRAGQAPKEMGGDIGRAFLARKKALKDAAKS